jgi:methylmalonyl-CoA/ethylmalonyl-CoA epimerase
LSEIYAYLYRTGKSDDVQIYSKTFLAGKKFLDLLNKRIMIMQKVEHIGIAVKSLVQAGSLYERLLGAAAYKQETVESEKVSTLFFRTGETKIELLEATAPDSVITNFIEKRGEGIHHIAFEVADILEEMQRLKQGGFILLSEKPKKGADNKLVCFVHPKSAHGVLIELCQEIKATV